MITERPKELLQELRKINGWKTLLKAGEDILYISTAEEEFLKEFGSDRSGGSCYPEASSRASRIIVTEGPLKGHEANIRRIDRHKRLAFLELHLFSEVIHTRVALEIYEKRAEAAFPDVEALYVHRRQEPHGRTANTGISGKGKLRGETHANAGRGGLSGGRPISGTN